jgi:hypothetical protein
MHQFIVSFGLLAIFVLMVAESTCIPIASEATMLLGGARRRDLAGHGPHPARADLPMVGIAAVLVVAALTRSSATTAAAAPKPNSRRCLPTPRRSWMTPSSYERCPHDIHSMCL